jgi:hypothetical protein
MNVSMKGSDENKKAYLKIAPGGKGDMSFVKFNNIDFENNGTNEIGEIEMKNSAYINGEKGTTVVNGQLNTDSQIRNDGIFEIRKLGQVNIKMRGLYKENKIKVWLSIIAIVLGMIHKTVDFYKPDEKTSVINNNINQSVNIDTK